MERLRLAQRFGGTIKSCLADRCFAESCLETIPSPVATFDIGDIEKFAENYKKCVEAIRGAIGSTDVKFKLVDGTDTITVPVTLGEDNTRRGTYVIEIRDGEKSLSLVATKRQAWFRGIVTNHGRRYEIDKMPTKMMKGSYITPY
ncbi:rRNA N-glycosidase [Hordeum vulgare]|nr:rRNA N-glycosidase [Hordeum vulgare]